MTDTPSMILVLAPPRLTGDPQTDNSNLQRWLFELYQTLTVKMQLDARLNAIAAVDQLPTNLTDPPTAAQLNTISTTVNAVITTAKRS
jgi:hypothetical protein